MSRVLQQRSNAGRYKTLASGWSPSGLRFSEGRQSYVIFSNGKEAGASCLRCVDAPCTKFANDETVPGNFDRFPADRNPEVCAAGAISQPNGVGAPTIDGERCVLCGVCSSRCPVGAIRLVPGLGAVVDDAPNDAFIEVTELQPDQHTANLRAFYGLPTEGAQLIESDALVEEVFGRMERAWTRVGDRFPNTLARNLLLGAGVGASMGRKGNNHMRMDLILSRPAIERGVAEVEFGQEAVLDAPRDMMDALAVLVSRYGWDLRSTTAIVVTDVLPNRRSEYWHIVQDILNVLGIKIGTVTIFALLMFNWNRQLLEIAEDQPFYADRDTISYRAEILENVIGRALRLSNSPRPQIDIAK